MVIGNSGTTGMWMVTRSPAFKSGKIAQHGRHLIYAVVKLLVGNGDRRNVFRLAHKDECRFIAILLQMTVHAVVNRR